jgi:hypothetical protein
LHLLATSRGGAVGTNAFHAVTETVSAGQNQGREE